MSRAEIEGGMRSGERRRVQRLFDSLELVPVTDAMARRAGRWLREHRGSHPGIDLAHYLIAAGADGVSAELVTLNVRHYPQFPTLQPAW